LFICNIGFTGYCLAVTYANQTQTQLTPAQNVTTPPFITSPSHFIMIGHPPRLTGNTFQ